MSPEQAEGKALDLRSDVFSFGAVLYEMIAGRRAFGGDTTARVLSAVLRDDPPPLQAPPPVERIVRRCLAKQPAHRFHTMADVQTALEQISTMRLEPAPSIAVLPFNWSAMSLVPTYARAGRQDQARAIYEALLARRAREYVPPFVLAVCASALGDHETAIRFCGAAVDARDLLFALFNSWLPDLEPLRADPRFAALIDQFNARMRSQP